MKQQDITDIVDELIELEPTLVEHRAALEKNVKAIIKAKPTAKITPAFKKKLLAELKTAMASNPQPLSPLLRMQKFIYAIGGAAVASIALYVTVINPMVPMPLSDENDFDGAMPIAMQRNMMMQNNGYVEHAEDAMGMPMEEFDESMKSRPQSGGGSDYATGRGGGGGGIPPMADSRMIAPGEPYPYTSIEYVYDGEITLPEESTLKAFKRTPLKSSSKADLLKGTFVSELMNISSLKSLSVINVSLSEGGDEPLMVNVDFNEGYISLNRQINYNDRPESKCRDEQCYQQYRLKERDMISDERTIEIANDFLSKLGVDTTNYGEPIMQNDWRMWLERESNPENYYFPEQLSVIYPYLINGNPVFDEWGNPSGMSVNVDVRLRAAIGLWGLRTMNITDESLNPLTDPEVVRQALRTGGANGYIPEGADLLQAKLGAPDLVYVSRYQWDDETMLGYETYVPALYFPVTMMPKESYEFRKAVVVPLSADITQVPTMVDPPVPMPMPMPVEPDGMMEMEMMEGAAG